MQPEDAGDVKKISTLSDKGRDYCVFSRFALSEETKKIPQLQPIRAYSFNGTMVATDIRGAEFMRTLVAPKKKYFYITSMEWMNASTLNYDDLRNIYLDENIDLIVSNKSDYKKISQLFKEPVQIIEDWNFEELRYES